MLIARPHVGKGESVRWGPALMLWCLESSCQHPDWCHQTPEVSGAVRTFSSRKSSPSVFLMLPLKSIVFITCFESLQGSSAPILHRVKADVYNKQPKKNRQDQVLTAHAASRESSLFSKAICEQHGVGREFQAVQNAQPALRAAHANTKYGVTTS